MPLAKSLALMATVALGGSARGYPESADILAEINRVRTDPAGYVRDLQDYRRGFEADGITHRSHPDAKPTPTLEGRAAVDDAIATLSGTRPSLPLSSSIMMNEAAGDLGAVQGASGEVGHVGTDGTTPGQRVQRRGGQPYGVAEVISYGQTTAAEIVRQLIVDGGVPTRGIAASCSTPISRPPAPGADRTACTDRSA